VVTFNIQKIERSSEVESEGLNCRKVRSIPGTNLGQYGKSILTVTTSVVESYSLVLGNFLSQPK
jgi:hypothetical protein